MLKYKWNFINCGVNSLFKNIENFKIENISTGVSKKMSSTPFRKSNLLVLRTVGAVRFTFPEHTFDTYPNDIIFLPHGSCYDLISTDSPSHYVTIRFEGDVSEPTPFVCSVTDFPEIAELKNNLTDMWKFGGVAEQFRCYSVVYNLFAYLKNVENFTYADKKNFNIIVPAVSYLKKHIYDRDLKIETLVNLCGISGTYFHKLFQTHYSMSPQKYILSKRLSQAKSIIDSGDFDSISEIALQTGYNDPLYFSRAFKKKYGVSPLNYAKQISMYH